MKINLRLSFLFTSLFLAVQIFGQMEVIDGATPPVDPESLITNIFLGDGVEVTNVTFQGDPAAVGLFTNGEQAVGIDRGILLTTGRAASPNCNGGTIGVSCNGNQQASNDNASTANDADLTNIAGQNIFDVAKYTITFIPTADTLRFKYVFASEEYPEFACNTFNDVFGFFISGPGITGPYTNGAENIALVPGTNIPVTINNVNDAGTNPGAGCDYDFSSFYNNNDNIAQQPVYDGYLDVFVAEYIVTPCETYTMKLAISDAGDGIYDTGVFLEAKSFGTGSLQVETATVSLDGTITESCSDGSISFSLPSPAESDYPLDYTIIGTATNGVDYVNIPDDLFIPQGDTMVTMDIIAIDDLLDEGLESIGIDIQRDICNRDTFWIFIRDNEIVPPELGADVSICAGDSVSLDGTLPIPLPIPPSFTNSQDYEVPFGESVFSDILVAGVQPVTLGPGVIQSVCVNIDHRWVDDLDIFLISPGGQFIELSTDNGQDCDDYPGTCFTPNATVALTDVVAPGYDCAGGESTDFIGEFAIEGFWEDLWNGENPTNGTWQLLVQDDAMGFDGTLLDWTITFEPLYQIYYEWSPTDGLSCPDCADPVATPTQTTTYHLTASDTYGCEVYDSITIEVQDVLPAPNVNCASVTNNSITFEWDNVPGAMGYQVSIDGANFTVPNNGALSHLVTGLTLSQEVVIEVFAIGDCDGQIDTTICTTPDCDAPGLDIIALENLGCAGDTDGSVTLQASGGAGNYTYELGGTTNTTGVFGGLSAGTYEASVIDDWMCPNIIQVNISEPDSIELDTVIINGISCFQVNDAAATVAISGGTFPFDFTWNGVQGDSIAMGLPPGTSTVEVADANGCSASASFEFAEPAELTAIATADSVDCFTASTGLALVWADGGTEPLTFQWDAAAGGATTPEAQNLPAGEYSVVVTDVNGCQVTATTTVFEPAGMLTSLSSTPTLCAGSEDGTATAIVNGGEPDYEYLWSNGQTAETATLLASNEYTLTVTDANGCSVQDTVMVDSPDSIAITLAPVDALCFGEATGSITATAQGGDDDFTYLWSDNSANASAQNLPAGNHCVTVTDGNGCSAVACTDVFSPDEIELTTMPTNAGCNGGSSGAVQLLVGGGAGSFSFLWDNGDTTQNINGLAVGTYGVTVTDANMCTSTASQIINESDAVELASDPTHVLCNGESTGAIDLTATGGTGSFTFEWAGPNNFTSTQEDPGNLAAGLYTVTAEDTEGCISQLQIEITEPATALTLSFVQPDEICFGAQNGSASIAANGGTPGYEYAWSNGTTDETNPNLSAGTYGVSVTDANGCEESTNINVTEEAEINVQLGQTPAGCHDGTDGVASLASVTQGGMVLPFPTLGIQWSNGNMNAPEITGLMGGETFAVTITNATGCTTEASVQVENPAEIGAALVSSSDVRCFGGTSGTATVAGQGGTSPYGYEWDANAGGQTEATANNLRAGLYVVTVSDANGCSTLFETAIGQPEPLELAFQNEKVECFGEETGTSTASATGGTQPYNFLWENGQTGADAEALAAGNLSVTLTDGQGCQLVGDTEIEQPEMALLAQYEAQDVTCFEYKDGRISISPEGGTPPYTYSLNGQDFYGNSTFIALDDGEYTVYVRDFFGCFFEVNDVFIEEPAPITIDLGETVVVPYDSQTIVEPTIEGLDSLQIANSTFAWGSNNPLTPVLHDNWAVGVFQPTSPTTASVVLTTENGCTAEDLVNIFVVETRSVEVPTGFAPEGNNGRNHALHVHGNSELVERIKSFQVFDRWGELMYEVGDFQINDESIGWDGTFKGRDMPAGVYVWYLEVDFIDGMTQKYKGHSTLIR